MHQRLALLLLFALSVATPGARADVLVLSPAKDNTLYESPDGSRSNGAGDGLFAGLNSADEAARRAVLQFEVAGALPAGSTIESVRLILRVTKTVAGPVDFSLHELLADWGEEDSDSTYRGGGGGANARTGDATWLHAFHATVFWTVPGGDFDSVASATASVGSGFGTFGSTPELVTDVQDWLDDPSSNFGWLVKQDDESGYETAKRFASREHASSSLRPQLEIGFMPPGGCHTTPYCAANPNSTELAALIFLRGSCSIADNDFHLSSQSVPNQPGIFFAGNNPIQIPFHDGYLCVGGGIRRLKPIAFGMGNLATIQLDLSTAGLVASTKRFQYWYRDPMGSAGANLSNAMTVHLRP